MIYAVVEALKMNASFQLPSPDLSAVSRWLLM